MKVMLFVGVAIVLTGCGAVAPIVALDGENYMAGSHGVLGNGSSSAERAKAVQSANDFCVAKNKTAYIDKIESIDPFFGRAPSADVRFHCENK